MRAITSHVPINNLILKELLINLSATSIQTATVSILEMENK